MKSRKKSSSGELFKFEEVGQSLKGYYLGSQEATGDYGPCLKHIFKTKSGVVTVFGSKLLNEGLEGEKPGILVEVTYTEAKPSKTKGRRPTKLFDFEFFDDQILDSSEVMSDMDTASSEEPNYQDDEPVEVADEEIAADEIKTAAARSAPAASTPSAAQRAKVEALLSSRRRAS